ncbi:MAG: ATP-dependent transcriptional regulator, partial [Pseudomonadota bacterium]
DQARLDQASRAVALAKGAGWTDERVAFSLLAQGRAALALDGDLAVASFLDAAAIYKDLTGDGIHSAQVALQLGAFAISSGRPDAALALLDRAIPAADGAQNAALLSTLLLLRAEATRMQGAPTEADRIRREGLAWGRYAWGDRVLARRAAEVAALGPGT